MATGWHASPQCARYADILGGALDYGKGEVPCRKRGGSGTFKYKYECNNCGGRGWITCRRRDGSGQVYRERFE
jgi:RecJ-like exonuclease